MDPETQKRLKRGEAIRAVLQQIQYKPIPAAEQVAIFLATNEGLLDNIPEKDIQKAQEIIIRVLNREFKTVIKGIYQKEKLSEPIKQKLIIAFEKALKDLK